MPVRPYILTRIIAVLVLAVGAATAAQAQRMPSKHLHQGGDSISAAPAPPQDDDAGYTIEIGEYTPVAIADSTAAPSPYDDWIEQEVSFNPDPTRAVWMSALFPGLGQVYNRRYWKLPIIIGGFMGLGYATSWNNSMLRDYSRAYRDLMDNDPDTRSYMNFFPPTTQESDLDLKWLTSVMQSRKNFYRRNRDLCIICMVGVYLIAMVDAYVDASLSHFDISPDLSMDWTPALMRDTGQSKPSLGFVCALRF